MSRTRTSVTLVWAVDRDIDSTLQRSFDDLGISVRRVHLRGIDGAISRAAREGPVVAVTPSHERCAEALRAGADEALHADGLSQLGETTERALLRGEARRRREHGLLDRIRLDDAAPLELFASAVGLRAERVLESVSTRCDAIDEALRVTIADESPTTDIGFSTTIREIGDSVDDAMRLVRQLRGFLAIDGACESDLRTVAWEVAALVRPAIEQAAEFRVNLQERTSYVAMPRWQIVQALGALLRNAVTRVAKRRPGARFVSLEVYRQEEDIAVVEVADDGVRTEVDPDLLHLHPSRIVNPSGDAGLAVVAARIRQAGGELLIESTDDRGTVIRVFLPIVAKPDRGSSLARRLRSVS